MHKLSARLALVVGSITASVAASALPMPSVAAATSKAVNTSPDFVVAYTVNVENLISDADPDGCVRDWRGLVDYMNSSSNAYAPDIVLVQQVSDSNNLQKLVNRMTDVMGRPYEGVLAVPNPRPLGGGSCVKNVNGTGKLDLSSNNKVKQTNAIIYRSGRFHVLSQLTWKSDARNGSSTACTNAADFSPAQDRTINIAARLRDDVTGNAITVASFHWPGSRGVVNPQGDADQLACAPENVQELYDRIRDPAVTPSVLKIAGGDANVVDFTSGVETAWHTQSRTTYGFTDAIYKACSGVLTCLASNTTNGHMSKRLDYLLVRTSDPTATSHATTVPWDWNAPLTSATQRYSDHRAVTARVYY